MAVSWIRSEFIGRMLIGVLSSPVGDSSVSSPSRAIPNFSGSSQSHSQYSSQWSQDHSVIKLPGWILACPCMIGLPDTTECVVLIWFAPENKTCTQAT